MTTLIVATCDVCGYSGRYKTIKLAEYHFPRHSCQKHLALREAAKAALEREAAIDRTPKPCQHTGTTHVHGTHACYSLDRCRCIPCTTAHTRYEAERRRRLAYGQSNLVDATPVRAHIEHLRAAGLGVKQISRLSGVALSTLTQILYGCPREDGTRRPPTARVRRETAQKILAIHPSLDIAAPGTRVPAVGSRRRLQALVHQGWSVQKLANRLGVDRQRLDSLVHGLHAMVTAETAVAVRELYDDLWDQAPPERSREDRSAAAAARTRARRAGWAPPLAWDEDTIDDPAAVPQHEVTVPNPLPGRRGVDLDEWMHLVRSGESPERAARRLGVALGAVERAASRHGREDVLDRIYPGRVA